MLLKPSSEVTLIKTSKYFNLDNITINTLISYINITYNSKIDGVQVVLEKVEKFLRAVPELQEELSFEVGSYAQKEIIAVVLGRNIERVFAKYLKVQIKQITNVFKGKAIMIAYLDVARYQTDVIDAAIEWGVDDEVLEFLVEIAPPPKSTEGRLGLNVPAALKRLRERV